MTSEGLVNGLPWVCLDMHTLEGNTLATVFFSILETFGLLMSWI